MCAKYINRRLDLKIAERQCSLHYDKRQFGGNVITFHADTFRAYDSLKNKLEETRFKTYTKTVDPHGDTFECAYMEFDDGEGESVLKVISPYFEDKEED